MRPFLFLDVCAPTRSAASEAAEDEIDNGVGKNCDDDTDNGVEDGIFCRGDISGITTRYDVTKPTDNDHDDRDRT